MAVGEQVFLGGVLSFSADTILELIHASFGEAGGWFPYNIQPFPLPNGDDLIQGAIPISLFLLGQKDAALGATIYTGLNLARMTITNLRKMIAESGAEAGIQETRVRSGFRPRLTVMGRR